MKRIFYLSLVFICLLVSGCGINSSHYPNTNGNTNVVIKDGNFRYLKKVTGECTQSYVFGIGGLSKSSLTDNAIQNMYDNANLQDGQVIINITTTVTSQIYFPIVYTKRHATAYGMVIEFAGDEGTLGYDEGYKQWEKKHRANAERVSAEPVTDAMGDNAAADEGGQTAKEMTYPTSDKFTFTVADGRKVVFAPGNLCYNVSERTWMFASEQYDALGTENSLTDVMDLFCWGTGDRPTAFTNFSTDFTDFEEWGRNYIVNGGKKQWRTLTSNEWYYLLNKRDDAKSRFTLATVNGVAGMLILPDNLRLPQKNRYVAGKNGTKASDNKYNATQWKKMEEKGCVFLPMTGFSDGEVVSKAETVGYYWSSSSGSAFSFGKDYLYPRSTTPTNRGCAVRLVREAQ